jgi:hypothetical protein
MHSQLEGLPFPTHLHSSPVHLLCSVRPGADAHCTLGRGVPDVRAHRTLFRKSQTWMYRTSHRSKRHFYGLARGCGAISTPCKWAPSHKPHSPWAEFPDSYGVCEGESALKGSLRAGWRNPRSTGQCAAPPFLWLLLVGSHSGDNFLLFEDPGKLPAMN